jgi:hypothetical protein
LFDDAAVSTASAVTWHLSTFIWDIFFNLTEPTNYHSLLINLIPLLKQSDYS